jgi:exodeoxyribonuclease VII small subunit
MATRKKKEDSSTEPSFEEALEQLEALVEAMENDQLPLEQLVANYEKGSKLMTHCQSVLESARERIELITLGNQGESGLENTPAKADVGSNTASSQGSGPDSDDDDIRLL